MTTMWEADRPQSKAVRACPGRGDTSMRAILKEVKIALPGFVNIISHQHTHRTTSPDPLNLEIKATEETAYQRAFFLARSTRIKGSAVGDIDAEWLDFEVPVVNNNSRRRPSLDLIGKVRGSPSMIVELKKAGGQSPFHAVLEALSYAQCAHSNHLTLNSHPEFKVSGKVNAIPAYWPKYKGKYIVVGGPDLYWQPWMPHLDLIAAAGVRWLKSSSLHGHHLMFVSFPSQDFKRQKGSKPKYTPHPLETDWTVLFEAFFPS